MSKAIFAVCLILLSAGFPTACQARPIDDFSVGPIEILLDDENRGQGVNQAGLPEGVVAGGVRRISAAVNTPVATDTGARVSVDTEQETFTVTTSAVLEGFGLDYGFGGPNFDLNLDFSEFSAFRIDVISYIGPALEVGFVFDSGSNGSGGTLLTIQETSAPASLLVPFAPYSAPDRRNRVDFGDIDFIRFEGRLSRGSELVLGGIFAVPEPATATLFCSGLILLAGRRSRGLER